MNPDTLLGHNLELLKVPGPDARRINDHMASGVALHVSADGEPSLAFNDQAIYHPTEPVGRAWQEIDNLIGDQKPDLVVFFGFGLGVHAELLRKKSGAPLVVFDPSLDITRRTLSEIALNISETTLVNTTLSLTETVNDLLRDTGRKLVAAAIPAYRRLFPEHFAEFQSAVEQALSDIHEHDLTRAAFSDMWVSHLSHNLKHLVRMKPSSLLNDVFAGKPGIFVGAGPSLDRNIQQLALAKDRAVICAVHSATQPLARAGIIPDFVVIIEGQALDYQFAGVENRDRITLIPSPRTHPSHLELGFGRMLAAPMAGDAAADWYEQAYHTSALPSGASVACAGFSLLHRMGCDPIVAVGMDLALTDGLCHSKNAEQGARRLDFVPGAKEAEFHFPDDRKSGKWKIHEVTAYGGDGLVTTRPMFTTFRQWFEGAGRTWAADRRLINATEGGARINGFEEMTFQVFWEQCCKESLPVEKILGRVVDEGPAHDPVPLLKAVQKELEHIATAVELADQAESHVEQALRLLKAGQRDKVQKHLDALAKNETRLKIATRSTRLLNTLVGHRVQAISRQKKQTDSGDKVAQTTASLENIRPLFTVVRDGGRELLKTFEPVLTKLQNTHSP